MKNNGHTGCIYQSIVGRYFCFFFIFVSREQNQKSFDIDSPRHCNAKIKFENECLNPITNGNIQMAF